MNRPAATESNDKYLQVWFEIHYRNKRNNPFYKPFERRDNSVQDTIKNTQNDRFQLPNGSPIASGNSSKLPRPFLA
ncbi:hypothetical protein L596_001478 [Steinernema carpocapsae]|uniref:Uncharacterized protein n=1 Tax=Steinernema carpocapsae TaxID=34508 RepID=A0A4U8ULW6_STECR|nr:hypothetical protein L596_001478 [Steinernema carpocapsae]